MLIKLKINSTLYSDFFIIPNDQVLSPNSLEVPFFVLQKSLNALFETISSEINIPPFLKNGPNHLKFQHHIFVSMN